MVEDFEKLICRRVGSKYASSTVNGTSGLHISCLVNGVNDRHEVLIPGLTFVATANAIKYTGGTPHFLDSEEETFGIDFDRAEEYLKKNTKLKNDKDLGKVYVNKKTGRFIKNIIPVHIFGTPVNVEKLMDSSKNFHLDIIEDAAEGLGSFYDGKHVGTFGKFGVFSFNGNKIITTGGGGMIVTQKKKYSERISHLINTAKKKHSWKYLHNEVGYNYRLPSINAAMGISQLKYFNKILRKKKMLQKIYKQKLTSEIFSIYTSPKISLSNYWLNTLILPKNTTSLTRDNFLRNIHKEKIFCRPIWDLLNTLKPYLDSPSMEMIKSKELSNRIINLPSSSHLVDNLES